MAESDEAEKRYWYVRRDGHISGPYSTGLIRRLVLLGRIGNDDELSHDQHGWKHLTQLKDLVPSVMEADPDDPLAMQRLEAARRWADDRESTHPLFNADGEMVERRSNESSVTARRHPDHGQIIAEKLHNQKREKSNNNFIALLLVLVVATVVGYYFSITKPASEQAIDCSAPAAPGVNWSNCFMQGVALSGLALQGAIMTNVNFTGADFSRADLSRADLSYASLLMVNADTVRLHAARLVGANLRGSNLGHADLTNADLSYANLLSSDISAADFTGAVLGNARWVDGKICAAGSISKCK